MASEERLKVLKMVQEGRINAEDAVELLEALEESKQRRGATPPTEPTPPTFTGKRDNRWFRVRVTDTDTGKTRVNVRLPIGMVSAGLKMGMRFAPEVEGVDVEEILDYVRSGDVGQIVDVYDDNDGEHVEVFIE